VAERDSLAGISDPLLSSLLLAQPAAAVAVAVAMASKGPGLFFNIGKSAKGTSHSLHHLTRLLFLLLLSLASIIWPV
jgi:hypothetical protein